MSQATEALPVPTPQPAPANKMPVGMILLSIYLGYSLVMTLWGLKAPYMLVGPWVLGRVTVICYHVFSALMLSLCLFGVFRRNRWARTTLLAWFGFWIAFLLFDFFLSFVYKAEVVQIYRQIMPSQVTMDEFTMMLSKLIGVGFVLVVNTIICWYAYSRKDYFVR